MKAYCRDLGRMDYKTCWDLQQELFDAGVARKRTGPIPVPGADGADDAGTVLLVEHPPVYTLGKSGHAENLLVNQEALEAMGAQFFHIDRGGDITFHGPGQLVCYPILDLERIGIGLREYIEALEEAVIRTVAEYGIAAGRIAGASGVWIDPGKARPRKICAIGVRSSRYVTMHGFALNVTTDLEWFSRINPCGFTDRGVTSIAAETGVQPPMQEVKQTGIKHVAVAGGVSANNGLRNAFRDHAKRFGWTIYIPKFSYTTDNAAMIGCVGTFKYRDGEFATIDLPAYSKVTFK